MTKHKGFTIVELIVVIIVIGILAAISIVSYGIIQKDARDTALRSDLASAGRLASIWVAKNSVQELRTTYAANSPGTGYAAWITGENANNLLTNSQLRWNNVAELPKIKVSPHVTLEIVARYDGNIGTNIAAHNQRMVDINIFCIVGAVRGGTYDYVPMSGKHALYDKMLFFDSALGKVVNMQDLDKAKEGGSQIACEGHLERWKLANP